MRRFLGRLRVDDAPRLESNPTALRFGQHQLLYCGYIANAKTLTDEARRRKHSASPEYNGEMFARAYSWWGAELSRHVLGEYAVAIYDGSDRSLLLAHDELALVPLFYRIAQDEIVFGTCLADVVEESGTRTLDEEYIADYLARGLYFGPRTPFTDVRRVAPGESVVWKNGHAIKRNTWTLTGIEPIRYRNSRDYEERFRQLTEEGVTGALPRSGKVWCELSGGLDSTTVFSFAVRAAAPRLEAVSFVYSQSYTADEQKWMRAALKKYPVSWHVLDVDSVRPFSELPSDSLGEPGDRLVTQAFSRRYEDLVRRHGVSVVLTGQGGDAVFLGDGAGPYFLADLLRTCRFSRLRQELCSLMLDSAGKRSMTYWLLHYAVGPMLRQWRRHLVEDYFHRTPLAPWLAKDYARRMNLTGRRRKSYAPRITSSGSASVIERVLAVTEGFTKHGHYHYFDIPFRHPLLYRPLIEFMLAIGWDQKFRPECDRSLQRRALTGVLPDQTLQRRDKGAPGQSFYEGLESCREWVELLTTNPCIVDRGYADRELWQEAVQQARLGRTAGLSDFLASVSLEAWLKQMNTGPRLARVNRVAFAGMEAAIVGA